MRCIKVKHTHQYFSLRCDDVETLIQALNCLEKHEHLPGDFAYLRDRLRTGIGKPAEELKFYIVEFQTQSGSTLCATVGAYDEEDAVENGEFECFLAEHSISNEVDILSVTRKLPLPV